ncbi:hypothetical protein E2C01_035976 [Portunus trituberculatus]|uniref:Uncharacterized protein n=1 Tax=Portunus trituberculatus TaxID=210409 RepID=A0A5B7F9U5_PORTR|nr:hypothetical protein [Portunus trituberculatus]
MLVRDSSLDTPRLTSSSSSSSSSKKRPQNDDNNHDEDSRTKKDRQVISGGQQMSRLENFGTSVPQGVLSDFSGFHDLSASETDEVPVQCPPNPLEDLDTFGATSLPDLDSAGYSDSDFLKALDDLSHHFHGKEEKGDPLSARLAAILNVSLRRRPMSEGIRNTCSKIKLPKLNPKYTREDDLTSNNNFHSPKTHTLTNPKLTRQRPYPEVGGALVSHDRGTKPEE